MRTAQRFSAIDHHVSKVIRARRLKQQMTLNVLGNAVGVSYQQIQKYETGANRITAGHLHSIAAALNTPVADFFPARDDAAAVKPMPDQLDPFMHRVKRALQDGARADGRELEAFICIAVSGEAAAVVGECNGSELGIAITRLLDFAQSEEPKACPQCDAPRVAAAAVYERFTESLEAAIRAKEGTHHHG